MRPLSAAEAKSTAGSRRCTATTMAWSRSASAWKRIKAATQNRPQVRVAVPPQRCRGRDLRQLGSESRPRLTHLGPSTLDLLPKCGIGLRQGNTVGFELALSLFEVFVDLSLVIQIEGDRSIDPG